jgi:hypothetical protein
MDRSLHMASRPLSELWQGVDRRLPVHAGQLYTALSTILRLCLMPYCMLWVAPTMVKGFPMQRLQVQLA